MKFSFNRSQFFAVRFLALLVIYSICRLTYYIYNIDLFPSVDSKTLSSILLGGLRFDLTAILYLNFLYFLVLAMPLSRKIETSTGYKYANNGYFFVVNLIGVAGNLIDTVYYQFTLQRTTFADLEVFQNDGNVTDIIVTAMVDFWPVTIVFFVLLVALYWLTKVTGIKPNQHSRSKYLLSRVSLSLLVIVLSVIGMRGGVGSHIRPIAMNNAGEYVSKANQMSIVLNTPFTFLRTLNKVKFERKSYFATEAELNAVFNPIQQSVSNHNSTQQNVVILILESFSAELSAYLNKARGYEEYKGYTPFLDSLMEDSLTFTNGFAHGRKSIDAIPSVVAGIPSMKVPYVISHYGTNEIQGLGKILAGQGYHRSFYHGAPNGSMGFNSIMKLAGFDNYFGMNEFNQANLFDHDTFDGTWGIWDEEFLQYMAVSLSEVPEPFVSTFFSLSSHHPFEIPARYQGQFVAETERLSTFLYADNALKMFFDRAKQQPWYDNTIFVITADHSSLPQREEYKRDVGRFRVPIVFYKPDGSLKELNDTVAQQADIFPTLLDMLGIEATYFSFGSSLLNLPDDKFAVSYINNNYQLVQDDYVLQFDGKNVSKFYNYVNDKELTRDLSSSSDERLQTIMANMEQKIKAIIQQYNNRMIDNQLLPKS